MSYGKSIELFLVNGTADSLVTAELSNWNGKAFKIPRVEVQSYSGDDLSVPGVYFLFCKDANTDADQVYIGESEEVLDRLKRHLQDFAKGKEPYEWNTAVVFVGKDLNKALIRYLEHQLREMAIECNRYDVLTQKSYSKTVLKPSQIAAMEEFIDNIRIVINALGYKVLDPIINNKEKQGEMLFFKSASVGASGVVTPDGFVVLAGSKISEKEAKSMPGSIHKRRLKEADKIVDYVTTADLLFSSSSAAAGFVAGCSSSGPKNWKRADGTALKDIQ